MITNTVSDTKHNKLKFQKISSTRTNVLLQLINRKEKKNLGYIENSTLTLRSRNKNVHLYRKNNSWGINYQLLGYCIAKGIGKIQFFESVECKMYQTTATQWMELGQVLQFSNVGYELQRFLAIENFVCFTV